MKLSTIWSLQGMSTMERLRRSREWGVQKIASKLPVRLKYWVTIQQLARVSVKMPDAEIPAIKMEDILKNLDAPKNLS